MPNFDRRLQRMIHKTHVNNRRELQSELKVFSALKERPNASNWEPRVKRAKSGKIKCYQCGKLLHKKQDCRSGSQVSATGKEWRSGQPRHERTNETCYRCQEPGHIATNCQKKVQNTGFGVKTEKRVELCAIVEPQSSMLVNGERFLITFGSRAECLLI